MTRPTTHALRAESLRLGYDGRTVVDGLDLEVPDGRITAIVGPNGSGKSTLLRGLGRLIAPEAGRVTLDGRDVRSYGAREFARRVAVLPQQPVAPDGVLVSLQNGFLRCVRCIGEIDAAGRCQSSTGQGFHRADRYEDGDYDIDTGECGSNLAGDERFLEVYFPVGALDASRGAVPL